MAKGSEKTTDALVAEKLPSLKDYPAKPNVENNGIVSVGRKSPLRVGRF